MRPFSISPCEIKLFPLYMLDFPQSQKKMSKDVVYRYVCQRRPGCWGVTTRAYKSCHRRPGPQSLSWASPHACSRSSSAALGSMALWWAVAIAVTCLGSLVSPGPVPPPTSLKELIEELVNITHNQKAPLCNGTMVWSVNLTGSVYCAALESLVNVSGCNAIQRTQRMLSGLCTDKAVAKQVTSVQARDTKIELLQFLKELRRHLQMLYRLGKFR
nr:interleukin-13 isoform X3 [Oryctolagus cuniculus]